MDFLVAYGKKSLEEIFNEIWPMARNQSSEFIRMLDGCFLGLLRKKSLEEIFNEIWPLARNNNL